MADIRIRVGASLDGSPSATFKSLADMAKRARAQVQAELAKSGEPLAVSVKANAKKAENAMRDLRAKLSGEGAQLMSPGTRAIKQFGDDAAKRFEETKRRFKELSGEVVKGAREIERAEKQANRSAAAATARQGREGDRYARRVATGAGRAALSVGRGALNLGTRVASSLASGSGIDLDFASHVARNVALESKATEVSSSGYMAGTPGPNGQRVDPAKLEAEARAVGNAAAIAPVEAMEGLERFVGKTGDLALGRSILMDMAILSKATGASMEDMVDAAGDFSNALGEDVPNKAEALHAIMTAIAGEGKLGAVEIKNMASQGAKLAGNAMQFEGDVAKNIVLLGALAQEARQRGGASSATMAATSVASFVNTLKTPARIAAFQEATGKKVFNKQGMLRDPETLILEALRARGMDPEGFKHIFANVQGARAVEGFASIYRRAGGGSAGEAAVVAEFDRLKNAAMGQVEIQGSLSAALKSTASQAQLFNNQMDATAKEVQIALLPALKSLAPAIISAAGDIAKGIAILTGTYDKDRDTEQADAIAKANAASDTLQAAQAGAAPNAVGPRTMTLAAGALTASKDDEDAVNLALAAARDRVALRQKEFGEARAVAFGEHAALEKDDPAVVNLEAAKAEEAKTLAAYERLHEINGQIAYQLKNGILNVRMIDPPRDAPKVDGKGRAPVSDTP